MNTRLRAVFLMLFVAVVLGAIAVPAMADADSDPPGVAGRLSYMQGPVSMQPGGVDDRVDASINRPLTTSDRLWADQGAVPMSMSPEEFDKFLRGDIVKWAEVVKKFDKPQ